ncbi:hypothetical protein BGZ47_008951 [Haplosporangium gracile]|nr:hypothetical protein BGZ47_008951 [Haplosporangium gracile]
MPPKKAPTESTATANNFFTRGKKPTTIQRIVTVKKPAVSAPAVVKKAQHHSDDEDDEDEVVLDEIEHANTEEDEDVQLHTLPQQQQVDEDEDDRVVDEYDSLNEEIEQSDDDSDAAITSGRITRSAGKTGTTKKTALDPITRPAAAKVTKPTFSTRSSADAGNNKKNKTPYIVLNIGDIHSGFHQADLSDFEKLLRQFDLASKYGPCTDMTRLERWERAFTLGLHPPQHVKDTLLQCSSLNTPLFEGRV